METLTLKQRTFNSPITKIILALLTFMMVVIIGQQMIRSQRIILPD
ncbi:hypothetical protein NJT12_20115 [Flavobacterium sp. AC]|uniref:Uncharacterized protein n=1 Tax=Flavobacterium azizsancarii TaxID=2961580 RepID=A0ABT4WHA3_9FLAO|nr:hypothetical protein [Flavobacterium azizsancarii]MDA6071932.1 hypothetical protein [Flavobacterium azizsancarii]